MHIGILPILMPFGGGVYQYSLSVLHALDSAPEHEFTVFEYFGTVGGVAGLDAARWNVQPLAPPSRKPAWLKALDRAVGEGPHRDAYRWMKRLLRGTATAPVRPADGTAGLDEPLHRRLTGFGIELMLYGNPMPMSFEARLPYVMPIHDLQHRLQPEWPEVSANGEFERREYAFGNGARYATLVLADSEVGKEDILDCYGSLGVTPDRVKVLPYVPAHYLAVDVSQAERNRVRTKYGLWERFFFYPAQFWPHKNHGRIVEALGQLAARGVRPSVAFCGSHSTPLREQAFEAVSRRARELGIEPQVKYLGFAPEEDMSALYAEAVALVMPTFFGPTNIPPLEAWAFGCPVLTSDIRGIREQMGDAALLVNPRSSEAIADGIRRLWESESLRRDFAERGRKRLASYTPEDFRARLIAILEEAMERVRAGDTPGFGGPFVE